MSSAVAAALLLALVQSPSPRDSDEAERTFERGIHHYNLGRFEDALDAFTKVYETSPHPALLFDIGQCHRNLGHHDRAIFFFERYVEQQPDAGDADDVRALLVELKGRTPAIVYDPPPLETATAAPSGYELGLPYATIPPVEEMVLVEQWWFWAAVTGAAAFAAGSVVLIATLTDGDHHLPERALGLETPTY